MVASQDIQVHVQHIACRMLSSNSSTIKAVTDSNKSEFAELELSVFIVHCRHNFLDMLLSHLLLLCCLLGLGSAWNQPSTCYVRQSSCSSGADKLDKIQETLASIQQTIATSFNGLIGELALWFKYYSYSTTKALTKLSSSC